jgi:hypothetical protein
LLGSKYSSRLGAPEHGPKLGKKNPEAVFLQERMLNEFYDSDI